MSGAEDTPSATEARELAALVRAEVAPLRAEVAAMREQLHLLTQPRMATDLDVDAVLAAVFADAGHLLSWTVRDLIERYGLPERDARRLGQALSAACRHGGGLLGRWRVRRDDRHKDRRGVVWRFASMD